MTESKRISAAGLFVAIIAAVISCAALFLATGQDIGGLKQTGVSHDKRLNALEDFDLKSQSEQLDAQAATLVEKLHLEADNLTNFLPVGTVIHSILEPSLFLVEGRELVWMLADGSPIPQKSGYKTMSSQATQLSSMDHVPDFRGLFLRGISGIRTDQYKDPDGSRKAGAIQGSMTGPHSHSFEDFYGFTNGYSAGNTADLNKGESHHKTRVGTTSALATLESRPNNAAVFIYLKYN